MAYKVVNLFSNDVSVGGVTIPPNGYKIVSTVPTLTTEQRSRLVITSINDPAVDDVSALTEVVAGLGLTTAGNSAVAAAALAGIGAPDNGVFLRSPDGNAIGPAGLFSATGNMGALAAAANPTPTIYFDPAVASTSDGSGSSAANACYTIAQLKSVANGNLPGAVIGLARGCKITEEVVLTVSSSRSERPVVITNYGSRSLPLPLIDPGITVTAWSQYSAGVYSYAVGAVAKQFWQRMTDGSERRIHWIHGADFATKLAKLQAVGGGYGFWSGNNFYFTPLTGADPTSGCMVMSPCAADGSASSGLKIEYVNQAASGNILVAGVAVRHTYETAIMVSAPLNGASITSLGRVSVVGCDVRYVAKAIDVVNTMSAQMPGARGNDAIIVYGKNDTVRPRIQVSDNFVRDCGNNTVEIAYVSGGYIERNFSIDACSHGIVEAYASVTGVTMRCNFARWDDNQSRPWYNGATPCYLGRIAWFAGLDAATASGGVPTNASAAKSNGNTFSNNLAVKCPAAAGFSGTAFLDEGVPGLTIRKNTLWIDSTRSGAVISPIVIGNSIASGWTAAAAAPAEISDNIFVVTTGNATVRLPYVSPNFNSSYAPTGGNNQYYSSNADWSFYSKVNAGADITQSTGPLQLAAWQAAVPTMDAGSEWSNPFLDDNGIPFPATAAHRRGAYSIQPYSGWPL